MTTASAPHTSGHHLDRHEFVAATRRRSRRWRAIIRASHAVQRHVAARFGTRSSRETASIFSPFWGGEMDCVHASLLALSKSPLAPIRQHHRPEHTAFCFAESPQSLVVKKRFGFCSEYLLALSEIFEATDGRTDRRTDKMSSRRSRSLRCPRRFLLWARAARFVRGLSWPLSLGRASHVLPQLKFMLRRFAL